MATENTESSVPGTKDPADVKTKKSGWTWDRTLEAGKILATLYAACLGTFVTMQFNERQHELARIEAIAKMLPSLAAEVEKDQPRPRVESKENGGPEAAAGKPLSPAGAAPSGAKSESKQRMVRDGAIWAIFRTAQNKNMLRDLANLFPEDIYRVVSSIAASGGMEHDEDEIMALQIASEKLANRYMDENDTALASKLYSQALRLKERLRGRDEPLYIVDLNERNVEDLPDEATGERQTSLLSSLNKLGDLHSQDSDESHKVNTGHYQSKQLYNRVRNLGKNLKESSVRHEVAIADQGLARLYEKEHRYKTAIYFLEEALAIEKEVHGEHGAPVAKIEAEISRIKSLPSSR